MDNNTHSSIVFSFTISCQCIMAAFFTHRRG